MRIGKLQIFIVNLLLIISCGIVITYSWVSINTKVDSNSMTMEIQSVSDLTTISSYALKFDGVYGATCYEVKDGTEIAMTEYDSIFKDRNVNTPLIYRLEISNVSTSANSYISVNIPCQQEYIITSLNTKTNEYTTGFSFSNPITFTNKKDFAIQAYISNVIRVTLGAGDNSKTPVVTESEYVQANEDIFNEQHEALKDISNGTRSKCFVTVIDDTISGTKSLKKAEEIKVSINYSDYEDYLFDVIDSGEEKPTKHLILYIMFDYDNTLMDTFIYSINEGTNQSFANDLTIISIENGGI